MRRCPRGRQDECEFRAAARVVQGRVAARNRLRFGRVPGFARLGRIDLDRRNAVTGLAKGLLEFAASIAAGEVEDARGRARTRAQAFNQGRDVGRGRVRSAKALRNAAARALCAPTT